MSRASDFYKYVLSCDTASSKKTLIGRVHQFAERKSFNVHSYVLNNEYRRAIHKNIKSYICEGTDGLTDSVRFLLCNEYVDHSRDMVQLLVSSF